MMPTAPAASFFRRAARRLAEKAPSKGKGTVVARTRSWRSTGMKRELFASAALNVAVSVSLAIGALWGLDIGGFRSLPRENALDVQLSLSRVTASAPIVVVDIDSEALRRYGPWPWSRLLLARIVDALAEAQPDVIGLDMLLAGEDRLSPAAVARRLGAETGRGDLAKIAGQLADGDAELSRALGRARTVLGAVLAQDSKSEIPEGAPILVRGAPRVPYIWRAESAIWPMPDLARAAAGVGLVVFENDADGVARRTPLLALARGKPVAGFAVETARVARDASALIIDGAPARLWIGDRAAPLGPDGTLRFRASSPELWARRPSRSQMF